MTIPASLAAEEVLAVLGDLRGEFQVSTVLTAAHVVSLICVSYDYAHAVALAKARLRANGYDAMPVYPWELSVMRTADASPAFNRETCAEEE